jgi:hypothetical protein
MRVRDLPAPPSSRLSRPAVLRRCSMRAGGSGTEQRSTGAKKYITPLSGHRRRFYGASRIVAPANRRNAIPRPIAAYAAMNGFIAATMLRRRRHA